MLISKYFLMWYPEAIWGILSTLTGFKREIDSTRQVSSCITTVIMQYEACLMDIDNS